MFETGKNLSIQTISGIPAETTAGILLIKREDQTRASENVGLVSLDVDNKTWKIQSRARRNSFLVIGRTLDDKYVVGFPVGNDQRKVKYEDLQEILEHHLKLFGATAECVLYGRIAPAGDKRRSCKLVLINSEGLRAEVQKPKFRELMTVLEADQLEIKRLAI